MAGRGVVMKSASLFKKKKKNVDRPLSSPETHNSKFLSFIPFT